MRDHIDRRVTPHFDIGKYFVQKIRRLREELDQGYVPNDQSYVLDDSDVNSDSTIPPTRIEAFDRAVSRGRCACAHCEL